MNARNESSEQRVSRGVVVFALAARRHGANKPNFSALCHLLSDRPTVVSLIAETFAGRTIAVPDKATVRDLFRDTEIYLAMERGRDESTTRTLRERYGLTNAELYQVYDEARAIVEAVCKELEESDNE
jgi:hypothetical protein